MNINNFAKKLIAGIKVTAGVALQLVGFVLWVPARIVFGISELLGDIGKQLVESEDASGFEAKVIDAEIVTD